MICWGERNCCGIFIDISSTDRCDCLRDNCIRDYEPEQRIMVKQSDLNRVIDHLKLGIDENLLEVDRMLQIKSIAADMDYADQNRQIIERLAERLTELEFDTEIVEVKKEDGSAPHFVVFANYFSTPAKNVVLIYGHTDVPDVAKTDPWSYPPFKLTEEKDMLFGRGLTIGKGPLMCWIQAIEAWLTTTGDLPVNIKMIIDSCKFSTGQTLRELIDTRKHFFRSVDLLIGSTNLWITDKVPMLTTCHSGYISFELEVKTRKRKKGEKTKEDPNCGCKPNHDPMSELCMLLNTLSDTENGILVDGLMRHVLPLTHADWNILCQAEVGIQQYKEEMSAKRLPHERSQPEFLKHRWCMPHLTIHSVEQHHSVSWRDLSKPSDFSARFSVKLVPDQSIRYVSYLIKDHLDRAYERLKCKSLAILRVIDQLSPLNEARHASFNLAAYRAYESTYNVTAAIPGNVNTCMPVMNELRRYCSKDVQVVGLPFCSIHMQPYQINEGLPREQYQKNLELFASMLFEIALVPPDCKCTEIPDYCYKRGKSTDTDFIRMMEPRAHNTHVLYELNEKEIDRTMPVDDAFPNIKYILLGKDKEKDTLH